VVSASDSDGSSLTYLALNRRGSLFMYTDKLEYLIQIKHGVLASMQSQEAS